MSVTEPPSSKPKRAPRRDWGRVGRIALSTFTWVLVVGMTALVVAPLFIHTDTYGIHDWDQMQAHRYLAVKTLKRYHQFPFWNPYSCGGHTWWGGLESGSSLISPWLPIYLLAPFTWALRLEVIGSALLSAIGTWLFAGRFTRSPGLRFIAIAAFALDGRFTQQASVGHTWHFYYAWTPWALYFLDRAIAMAPNPSGVIARTPLRDVTLLGATLALMVYTGGIYPLPQTIIVIAIYATACAVFARSFRPIGLAIAGGALSFAFSAPRLLPMMDMLRHYPRLVDSPESMDLAGFISVFTSKENDHHGAVGPWGWHEFGIYIGWIPFLMMLAALAIGPRARERALRLTGSVCIVLAFGRFDEHAPWALAHDYFPIFESQHVPSRWLYPAVLVLIVSLCSVAERLLLRQSRRAWLEVALVFFAAYIALDIGLEVQRPLVGAFVRQLKPIEESVGSFHQETQAPAYLRYDVPDWAPPNMPSMIANVGIIDCNTFPGFNSYYRDKQNHTPGLGAKGVGDVAYHGEVYLASGVGRATIDTWTPNAVTVSFHGAKPGDLLVLNQNWDAGWRASGGKITEYKDTVAAQLDTGDGVVTFRYIPRFFFFGCLVFALALLALALVGQAKRAKTTES